MKKAIIIGATSGIGRELAKVLSSNGCEVGIAGRRTDLLKELSSEMPSRAYLREIDVNDTNHAMRSLEALIEEMGGVDIVVISAGTGHINAPLDWQPEKETIDTNVSGFAAMANVAMGHFIKKGSGHLVGISSVAGIRGDNTGPAYSASKAFMSNYLSGLRKKTVKEKLPITVTDILPGFVDTAMAKGDGLFWVASPQEAARQIYNAIRQKKSKAYITKRWAIIAWLLRLMPDFLYNRI